MQQSFTNVETECFISIISVFCLDCQQDRFLHVCFICQDKATQIKRGDEGLLIPEGAKLGRCSRTQQNKNKSQTAADQTESFPKAASAHELVG